VKRSVVALALAIALSGCNLGAGNAPAPQTPASARAGGDLVAAPEVVSSHGVASFNLSTIVNSATNFPNFFYEGYLTAPTIRVHPGDTIVVNMSDDLNPGKGAGSDMNLHFHGLDVAPTLHQDDVLTMLARPDQALYYQIKVPVTQPPGLYWYHPHVHGETDYQVGQGGMSGAIVVEGMQDRIPALAKMQERILIVRELGRHGGEVVTAPFGSPSSSDGNDTMAGMEPMLSPIPPAPNTPCAPLAIGDIVSVNSQVQPTIRINPGEPQFFRVLNATGHRTLDLSIDGIPLQLVAFDGYPLDVNPKNPAALTVSHVVVPPAGRVEFVATGTKSSELRTLCYDSGPVGDPDPMEILAHLRPTGASARVATASAMPPLRAARVDAGPLSAALPPPAATRLVRFSEDQVGYFYINGKRYSMNAPPMFVVHVGTVERWRIENETNQIHDFHLHQVHFIVEMENGVALPHAFWRDSVVVPPRHRRADGTWVPGSIELTADFRNPLIRGTFLFHCHILDHEDLGMMAKIQAI